MNTDNFQSYTFVVTIHKVKYPRKCNLIMQNFNVKNKMPTKNKHYNQLALEEKNSRGEKQL